MTSNAERKEYALGFYEPALILERKMKDKKEKNRQRALKAWETMRNKEVIGMKSKTSKEKNRLRALKAWETIRRKKMTLNRTSKKEKNRQRALKAWETIRRMKE